MSKIRITTGPYRGREKTMGNKPMTIGRDAEASIQILDRSASRFHAEVFPVGGMYFVRDLDSKNGTLVNDDPITDEELLREGDVIKIGSTELVYEPGNSLQDDESSSRISYRDEDQDALSKTLEFRLDELSDISEPKDQEHSEESARSLRMLYQIGRLLSDPGGYGDREGKVLEYLVTNLPAESGVVFRREGTTGKLVPATVRTAGPNIQPVISRSIVKKAFTENKALHIANAMDDDRFERLASVVSKGVRSVLAVPLAIGGAVRGVLYLARGEGVQPFEHLDLELVSAMAIQLGMCHQTAELRRKNRLALVRTVASFVAVLEARDQLPGSGERCARFCAAISTAMRLDTQARDRLVLAGHIHPVYRAALARNDEVDLAARLERIDDFEPVVTILHGAVELGDDADTEARILACAHAFLTRLLKDPGADAVAVIADLRADRRLDPDIIAILNACHLDGTLYNARIE